MKIIGIDNWDTECVQGPHGWSNYLKDNKRTTVSPVESLVVVDEVVVR